MLPISFSATRNCQSFVIYVPKPIKMSTHLRYVCRQRVTHTHTNILEVLKTEIWNRNRVMWNLATKHSHKHAQLCLCMGNKMGLKIQAFPVAPSKNLNQLCNLKRSSPLRCISWNFINTNKTNICIFYLNVYLCIYWNIKSFEYCCVYSMPICANNQKPNTIRIL